MEHKICKECKIDKNLNEYHINKITFDGRKSKCKECYIKISKKDKVRRDLKRKHYHVKSIDFLNRNNIKDIRLYNKFISIKNRVNSKNKYNLSVYRSRGIKNLWENYEEFQNDMYKSYIEHVDNFGEKNTTLDRIDNDKGYFKENCRWATWKEQRYNQRIPVMKKSKSFNNPKEHFNYYRSMLD